MANRTPYLVSGITVERGVSHPYIGLGIGSQRVIEFRIYEDREGWFVDGNYTPGQPSGSKPVEAVLNTVPRSAFLATMAGEMERWKLKELLGI